MQVTEFRFKLYPKDFDLSRRYYEKKLGFAVMHQWDRGSGDKGVMFKVGGAVLELLSPEDEYQPVVGCDLSLAVPDVWKLWEVMKNDENVIAALGDNAWRDTSFCIRDPDGLKITFFTKR
jgi:catechol 2,3-dioxygenase-like lactoylglutathione lyase family enzyme